MSTQGEPTTRVLAERLIRLARIKAGIMPVLNAARGSAQKMEELYRDQGIKDPIYHDMKAVIGPMERLSQRVDQEIDKILTKMGDETISDSPPEQTQNDDDVRSRLKRNLHRVG